MDTNQKINNVISIAKRLMYAAFFASMVVLIPACNKDDNDEKAHLSIRMTDAPANYDAVFIDVQGVEIIGNSDKVFTLNTNAGIYNLLDYSNGLDTLIASGDLEAGKISQIRLILGTNNTVVVDGIVHPLSTPSAQQSGLKLKVNETFEAGVSYSILLDFDANQSIVATGNGEYQLKPVIRTINTALSGSIRGSVTPIGLFAVVTATSDGIAYSSVTNANGEFLISGLPAGVYSVTVSPNLPILPVTLTGKIVTVGVSTNIGVVVF
jgi:hypothetical protein